MKKLCKICGTEFEPIRTQTKICSDKCRKKNMSLLAMKSMNRSEAVKKRHLDAVLRYESKQEVRNLRKKRLHIKILKLEKITKKFLKELGKLLKEEI